MDFMLPRSLFKWLFFSTLLFFKSCNAEDPSFFRLCSQSANYTDGSLFHSNLHQLFLTLVDNGPINGFYNTSTGQNPEKIYGLIQCRGDVVGSDECGICLNKLITEVMELCPNKKEAVFLLDNCLMRYSTVNFFGAINTSILAEGTDVRSVSDPFNPDVNAQVLMDRLVGRIPSSALRFAADNLSVGESDERRYGMVQCTRDLSNSDCGICLNYLLHNTTKVVEGSRGWRILAVSCLIRYEDYPFAFGENSNGGTTGGRRLSKIVVVIISLVAALAMLLLGSAYCLWRKKEIKKVKKENFREVRLPDVESPTRTSFSYADLFGGSQGKIQDLPLIDLATVQVATDNFSNYNKLGKGGFGPVYKGKLVDGREVAVKRLSNKSGQGLEEFKNEVVLIAKLQHKNLVRLLFCCLEREEKLLIYEYMPNRSLDVFLFDPNKRGELDWRRRFSIIVGIARGLLYLHEDSRLKVIHRDLKASNILLDNDMNPKISDFGIARIFDGEQSNANTNRIIGTYGYMAPEYAMGGLFSVKSDVFSFGVLIIEIITGRKNSGFHLSEDAHSLLLYAWRLWSEDKGLELMDPLVGESFTTSEVVRCIHIGLLCVQGDAADRPTMSLVVHMLASDFVSLPQPLQPAFSVRRSITSSNQSSNSANDSCTNNVTISEFEPR